MSSRLVLCFYLILIIVMTFMNFTNSIEALDSKEIPEIREANKAIEDVPKSRTKRGIFWDFFQKMITTKNLIVDQYVDTRETFSEVYNLLNEGFSDPTSPKSTLRPPTSTTKTSDEDQSESGEMSTTTEAYSISRYELGRILGRNFRGLQRLTKIEFQDAFNQSHYNIQEYKAEARKQFANSVGVEKVNKLKGLKTALTG